MKKLLKFNCVFIALLLSSPIFGRADVVTDWNSLMLDAIRNESSSSPLAARNLAILHTAIYDAVNSIDLTHESYLSCPAAPPGTALEAAVVGAAYECGTGLYPSQTAAFDAALSQFLGRTLANTNRDNGLVLGRTVALSLLAWRSADGSSTSVPYVPSTEPGQWRRTPPFNHPPELPQWPFVTPFVITNGAQFRPAGPPSLTSTQYTRDWQQVQQVGSYISPTRTAQQSLTARFWSDFSYTSTGPGHWNQIAQSVATNNLQPQSIAQTARLFALLNLAMADTSIAAWDAKYAYNFWTPQTAIQLADIDGNASTTVNTNWIPLLTTPFYPEYVSEHSAFSAAAATVLASVLGTDDVQFSVGSDILTGSIRSYDRFSAAAEENGLSRVYGGVDYFFSHIAGAELGRHLGEFFSQNSLRSLAGPIQLTISIDSTNRTHHLSVTGTANLKYVVESSTDFIQWTPVVTNAAPFSYDGPLTGSVRFYRAAAVP